MNLTYFDAKAEIKKIHNFGMKAIKSKDVKYINFLVSNLDQLESSLKDKFVLDAFGLYVLKKEINQMRHLLTTKIKKSIEDNINDKKSRRNTK